MAIVLQSSGTDTAAVVVMIYRVGTGMARKRIMHCWKHLKSTMLFILSYNEHHRHGYSPIINATLEIPLSTVFLWQLYGPYSPNPNFDFNPQISTKTNEG